MSSLTTILLNNTLDIPIILSNSSLARGEWPIAQPPWRVSAQSLEHIIVQDSNEGTQASIIYTLVIPELDDLVTFTIDIADSILPCGQRHFRASTEFDDLITVNVETNDNTRERSTAQVDIIPTPQLDLLKTNQEAQLDLLKARDVALSKRFEIGFDALGVVTALDAIHESITLAAFIARAHPLFPQTSTYDNANNAQWEFLRGILWNDDPRCLLFDDDDDDNHNFGLGVEFLAEFQFGNPGTLTQRSHYGDLQFLHAMASAEGESPHATKAKIMHWVEVMYKLAAGAQSINPSDKLSAHFPSFFNATTKPSGDATLATLLVGTTPSFTAIDVRKRALGTCLHLIQDSYAVGHTARVVLNPGDMVPRNSSEDYILFPPSRPGRFGPIRSFHAYNNQDHDRHSHYDALNGAEIVYTDPSSYNAIIGARDAIEMCATLIAHFMGGSAWEQGGVRSFLEMGVFALASGAEVADGEVDPL